MVSRRDQQQTEIRFKVMRLIFQNPDISTRQLADKVGISNGSAYYVLNALIEKGSVKLENLKNDRRRRSLLLTPKGIREKSLLTQSFIKRKRQEFEDLKAEIQVLEGEAGIEMQPISKRNDN